MQPRIFLRPTNVVGRYYSAHNFTQSAARVDLPPASSLLNFPPVYTSLSHSQQLLNETHTRLTTVDTSEFEASKQQADDILRKYMAEAILDNRRAMAAAGLLGPTTTATEAATETNKKIETKTESLTQLSPSPSSSSESREVLHTVDTVLHLSRSITKEQPMEQQYSVVNAILPPDKPSGTRSISTSTSTLIDKALSAVSPHVSTTQASTSPMLRHSSSAKVSEEEIHSTPTESAKIFSSLLKVKGKSPRSSSRHYNNDEKLTDIITKNSQLSKAFTESILNLEYLVQREKEAAQYAHFATVLQNERSQADQREQAQSHAIQLLLQRIAELEGAAKQHVMAQAAPSFMYPAPVPSQCFGQCSNMQQTVPQMLPPGYGYPHTPFAAYNQVPPATFPGPITVQPPNDGSSVSSLKTPQSTIKNAHIHSADQGTTFSLSRSETKMDPLGLFAHSPQVTADSLRPDCGTAMAEDDALVHNELVDAVAIQRRLNFRSKMYTGIPPDPPPLQEKEYKVIEMSPTIIQSSKLIRLPPEPVSRPKKETTSAQPQHVAQLSKYHQDISNNSLLNTDAGASHSRSKDESPRGREEACSVDPSQVSLSNLNNFQILHSSLPDTTAAKIMKDIKVVDFTSNEPYAIHVSDSSTKMLQTPTAPTTEGSHGFNCETLSLSSTDAVLAPNLEYNTQVPYPYTANTEAESPTVFQVQFTPGKLDNSSGQSLGSNGNRRVKFTDQMSSSSVSISSASKASTVSVEVMESDGGESASALVPELAQQPTQVPTITTDDSSLFPTPHSAKDTTCKPNSIRSILNAISSSSHEQSSNRMSSSSESLLQLPNLSLELSEKPPPTKLAQEEAIKVDLGNTLQSIEAFGDIISEFTDLDLEIQQNSAISGHNQSLSIMNSLIETASNQASMFKRSLEEALKRSMDTSICIDKLNKGSTDSVMSPGSGNTTGAEIRVLPNNNHLLDIEGYESNVGNDQDPLFGETDLLAQQPHVPMSRAAKAPLVATNLLNDIRKSLSAVSFSSRHSFSNTLSANSAQNSVLFPSVESQTGYRLCLPGDSFITGYQPDVAPPTDEYIINDPDMFPSHSLEDVEGSNPSTADKLIAQNSISNSVDLGTSKDTENSALEDGHTTGTDAPCVNLDIQNSTSCATGPPDSTQNEAVVFRMKSRDQTISGSLASSSRIASPKRTTRADLNGHKQPRGNGFGQRKLYGATTMQAAPITSPLHNSPEKTSSSDDFNVASLSSKTESTSPLKPTQLGRAHLMPTPYQYALGKEAGIKPVASESESSPNNWTVQPTNTPFSFPKQTVKAPVVETLISGRTAPGLTEKDNPFLNSNVNPQESSIFNIPDLNSTSISEERPLKEQSASSSHVPTRFSVAADIDGLDNFYDIEVDLLENGFDFEDL